MSTIEEIESAIQSLSHGELAILRDCFERFDAAAWDKQFEKDVVQCKLNLLADEALKDFNEGRSSKL